MLQTGYERLTLMNCCTGFDSASIVSLTWVKTFLHLQFDGESKI